VSFFGDAACTWLLERFEGWNDDDDDRPLRTFFAPCPSVWVRALGAAPGLIQVTLSPVHALLPFGHALATSLVSQVKGVLGVGATAELTSDQVPRELP
jgi:hypothetical protein